MMKTMRFTMLALLLGGVLGSSVAEAGHPDRISCSPTMVCAEASSTNERRCPAGNTCVCVPSCPVCDDCAAEVCVPVEIACHSACDCPDGMGCAEGYCSEDARPIHCCDSEDCPAGERCQDARGNIDICKRECRTACDCEPGLGCFDGQCIAGIAPVYCCEGDVCPVGNQCQHPNGRMDRCRADCVDQAWLCGDDRSCGEGRVCGCTASCPNCEDCGPNVCMPPNSPTPYRCNDDGGCSRDGDKCICISSCPECDDCALNVCVPNCEDPMCEKRLRMSERRINRVIEKTRPCRADNECAPVNTSTGCQGDCGAYVNRRYAERVQNFINHVDERYCTGYQEAGCPFVTPACQQTVGACVRGKCTGVPAPIPVPGPFEPRPGDPSLPIAR